MWASNLDFQHKPVIIAAVLGLVAIFPLLGLANGLLLFTADTQRPGTISQLRSAWCAVN